jgi:hypothetical protein
MLELKLTAQAYDAPELARLLREAADEVEEAIPQGSGPRLDQLSRVSNPDAPDEQATFTLRGEAQTDAHGVTVSLDAFECGRCGEHVGRGDTFFENDAGAYCTDCGMDVQDGDDHD